MNIVVYMKHVRALIMAMFCSNVSFSLLYWSWYWWSSIQSRTSCLFLTESSFNTKFLNTVCILMKALFSNEYKQVMNHVLKSHRKLHGLQLIQCTWPYIIMIFLKRKKHDLPCPWCRIENVREKVSSSWHDSAYLIKWL